MSLWVGIDVQCYHVPPYRHRFQRMPLMCRTKAGHVLSTRVGHQSYLFLICKLFENNKRFNLILIKKLRYMFVIQIDNYYMIAEYR